MPVCIGRDRDISAAFLAFPGYVPFLCRELQERFGVSGKTLAIYGDLVCCPIDPSNRDGAEAAPCWCRTAMRNPLKIHFDSIGDAARYLSSIQRNWAVYAVSSFRRAALIQQKLPHINTRPRPFPFKIPHSSMGLCVLLDGNTMLASPVTSSPLPAGAVQLREDHENPPSRAYLKLQEALIRMEYASGRFPKPGEKCLDAGACPGGWTWALAGLGCSVLAVDRKGLAAPLMDHPLVRFTAHDAFTLKPQDLGFFNWVFSDVICYPQRLLKWVEQWRASGLCRNMICTVKLQGETDWDLINAFARIPSAEIMHLNYNKHEFTWFWHDGGQGECTNPNGVS